MTPNYILETGLCWLFFYLLYTVLLKKETFFSINRLYLIGTLLLGLLIPAIDFIPTEKPAAIAGLTVYLSEITVLAEGTIINESGYSTGGLLMLIYKAGVLFFLFRFLTGIAGILRLFRGSTIFPKGNYKQVYTQYEHAPFSFLNYFFVSQKTDLNEKEWEQVLRHEQTHIEGRHTLDILLAEVLIILFWFNPLVYLYKNAIRNVHEYLADAAVIKTVPTVHYGRFLLTYALPGFRLANNFNHSQLKKRIAMMTKTQSPKHALTKYTLFIPLLMLMFIVFSCRDTVVDEVVEQSEISLKVDNSTENTPVVIGQSDREDNTVYTIVDEMPRFPGCEISTGSKGGIKKCADKQLLQHIYSNIKYPKEARDAGIEGMVVVSFIIEKDGSLSDAQIVRSIEKHCDAEVLRVVGAMPKWVPGEQDGQPVRVKFNLPVRFKLAG